MLEGLSAGMAMRSGWHIDIVPVRWPSGVEEPCLTNLTVLAGAEKHEHIVTWSSQGILHTWK